MKLGFEKKLYENTGKREIWISFKRQNQEMNFKKRSVLKRRHKNLKKKNYNKT